MWRLVLAAAGIAAAVAGTVYWSARPETALERIRRQGVVRIGYSAEPPYAIRRPGGYVTGESPEVARAVFRKLGVRAEWVQTEFRALIPELRAGRFDVIAAGMFRTPERSRLIAFSLPTYVARPALLVRTGDSAIRGLSDVARAPHRRVAVLRGSAEEVAVRAIGVTDPRTVVVPDLVTGVEAVRSGRADALALTIPTLRWLVAGIGTRDLAVVYPLRDPPTTEASLLGHGAFGFRQDDGDVRAAFDSVLRRFLGTPEHLALVRGFGFTALDVPAAMGR